MIKVELFYKVSIFETDWMMSEEEYEEFRTNALNLPLALVKGAREEVELEHSEIKNDDAEDCPDFIDQPVGPPRKLDTEFLTKEKDKTADHELDVEIKPEEPKQEPVDPYQKYVEMFNAGHQKTAITTAMINDLDIASTTANQYYYSKIKPLAETADKEENTKNRELEKEKKDLFKEISNETDSKQKIEVIPEVKPQQPKEGKHFTDEFKQKILKQSSGSFWGR